jgi:hypothetical protein
VTLLQPTDVPSMAGINNAITSKIADAVSTTDPSDQFYDSGWLTLQLRAGFQTSSETPQYRKIGHVVYLRGRIAPTSGTFSTGGSAVADLPAGFRPTVANEVWATAFGINAIMGRFFIGSGGALTVDPGSATADAVPISTSFVAG